MDSASLIAAGFAFSALVFALYQTTISRRSADAQTRMTYEVLALIQKSRESDPQDSVTQELLARLSSNTEPRTVVVNVAGPRDADRFADSESVGAATNCGDIVREIAHGLSTPLSQIDAASLNLLNSLQKESSGGGGDYGREFASLDRIRASVELCKLYIEAYREVAQVAESASDWSPESLPDAIRSAARVYSNDSMGVQVSVPTAIDNYSNTFVLAALLPLIENAIEESRSVVTLAKVSVDHDQRDDGWHVFTVKNGTRRDGTSLRKEIYDSGYTTKEKHQGLGLSAALRLVGTRGGSIDHRVEDGIVIFEVTIPRGSHR